MKKIPLAAAIGLSAVGSWAFYPKAAAESSYMVLSLRVLPRGESALVTIAPDGTEVAQPLSSKSALKRAALPSAQAQCVIKLNELRSQGWVVIQVTSNDHYIPDAKFPSLPDYALTETYLLEKR